MKNYETEARERWGNTDAYREHEQKTKSYTKEKWAEANDGMMAIFVEFAACKQRGASAGSAEAQALVAKLQAHITANYYNCTDEILAGLGKMYRGYAGKHIPLDVYPFGGKGSLPWESLSLMVPSERCMTSSEP